MDSDFWRTRLAAAKRQFNMQNHHHFSNSQLDRINLDDFEIEEEVRPDYPCPYCYEEFDVASLCSHLEDEHSCESKAIVSDWCIGSTYSGFLGVIMGKEISPSTDIPFPPLLSQGSLYHLLPTNAPPDLCHHIPDKETLQTCTPLKPEFPHLS
ncbi:protein dehydration-induced [Sesamum angolense]|uniref:Protein dehydration-induced n=1 Tax=Sesamum angolense TaxID=2727404 RepID=A0AAE1WTR9_9LAMI|nr:protein dehydration-induced [Sesamum angolense]